MRHLESSVCEAITELIFVRDNPVLADVTFVLGMSLWRSPLEAALRLFAEGGAGTLIFTGGHNDRIGRSEADVMAEEAIGWGVPRERVLCENRARHTRENFEFSWNMILARKEPVRAVNIVAIHHHMRRALLTARAVLPPAIRIGHVSYASMYFSPANWHACERGKRDVLQELAKLQEYFPETAPAGLSGHLT